MIKERIAEVLKERIRICEETDDNWDYGIEECRKKFVEIITVDIDKSIDYFLHECTDEELYWLSETFEEIAEKTQFKGFISAWRTRLAAITPENYNQQNFKTEHIRKWVDYKEFVRGTNLDIDFAEGKIDE